MGFAFTWKVRRRGTPARQTSVVRIGAWNLQGRWDERHRAHVEAMRCDVLLLTEVSEGVAIPGMNLHSTKSSMAPRRRWASCCILRTVERAG